jgi:hypothetical protein
MLRFEYGFARMREALASMTRRGLSSMIDLI